MMDTLQTKIINELGREIIVSVGPSEEGGLSLKMEGPDSTCENIVTQMEAETLYDLLGRALKR